MRIIILGVGSLGSNIAMNLAFDRRQDELVLVDKDKIEARNYQFGTQQYSREQLGHNKINALQFNIFKETGKIIDDVFNSKVEDYLKYDNFEDSLLIDCLDNFEAREAVRKYCEENKIDCIHIGFSPQMTFSIEWNENYKTPDDIMGNFDICTLTGASSFVKMVSGFASLVIIEYLEKGFKKDFVGNKFNISEIK